MMLRLAVYRLRLPLLLLLALICASLSYAAAAGSAADARRAGSGNAGISAYTVNASSIRLALDIFNDPARITGMSFTLNLRGLPAPATVRAQVLDPSGSAVGGWYSCSGGGGSWSCSMATGGTYARLSTVAAGAPQFQLRVVAVQ